LINQVRYVASRISIGRFQFTRLSGSTNRRGGSKGGRPVETKRTNEGHMRCKASGNIYTGGGGGEGGKGILLGPMEIIFDQVLGQRERTREGTSEGFGGTGSAPMVMLANTNGGKNNGGGKHNPDT